MDKEEMIVQESEDQGSEPESGDNPILSAEPSAGTTEIPAETIGPVAGSEIVTEAGGREAGASPPEESSKASGGPKDAAATPNQGGARKGAAKKGGAKKAAATKGASTKAAAAKGAATKAKAP